jgi:hypothetical protein
VLRRTSAGATLDAMLRIKSAGLLLAAFPLLCDVVE